ncbi:MAG TPA: enoyl-CoA hydratase-related protein [Hyphomonadaceae bacterium]|nr:enoyl-CoA hydratase-related protein [Hyphomonadaceae bacterium]
MAYENIVLDVSADGTAVLTLNRPQKRNAFNAEVIEELSDAFETLSKNPECRLVLIRGNGPVFSAGADLEWMKAAADYTQSENEEDAFAMAEMLRHFYELPQATIALVHGAAMAGACGLVAAADIAIARAGSIFAFSEVKLGIIPATISPYIVAAIGPRHARSLFVTAERFDAETAHRLGLIHHVVADEEAMEKLVEHYANMIYDNSPAAIADAKQLVEDVTGEEIDSSLGHMTAKRLAHRRVSQQGKEGLAAFLEKRKPSWAR